MKSKLIFRRILAPLAGAVLLCAINIGGVAAWGADSDSQATPSAAPEKPAGSWITPHTDDTYICMSIGKAGNNGPKGGDCTFNGHLVFDLDFQKMGFGSGAMHIDLENRQGPGITKRRLGDFFGVNHDEGRNFQQVSEMWYKGEITPGMQVKIGQMDVGADYQSVGNGGDFLSSAFGVMPNIPVPTYPNYVLGTELVFEREKTGYFKIGAFDGSATSATSRLKTAFDSTFYAVEYGYSPPKIKAKGLIDTYKVGAYMNAGGERRVGNNDLSYHDTRGVYVAADRTLARKTGMFIQLGVAPANRSLFDKYFGAGFAFHSFMQNRPDDTAGFACARGRVNDFSRTAGLTTNESVLELYYKAQLTRRFNVMPDFQLVMNPGGTGKSNLVNGLKAQFAF